MCLYTKRVINPRYKKNKKNGGNVPAVLDHRKYYIPVMCGKCSECMKRRSREWNIRLTEDLKENKNGHFVTFSYDNKSLKHYYGRARNRARSLNINFKEDAYWLDNEVVRDSVRHFLERYRKKYGKSLRHWITSELGGKKTERIHLHGFVWFGDNLTENERRSRKRDLESYLFSFWKNGNVYVGYNYNRRTIRYTTKYLAKVNPKYKNYKPKLCISPGIGRNYTNNLIGKKNDFYRTESGHKIALPLYWRNKIFTEEERDLMWSKKLDEDVRYIAGIKVDQASKNTDRIMNLLEYYQKESERRGFKVYAESEDYENEIFRRVKKQVY